MMANGRLPARSRDEPMAPASRYRAWLVDLDGTLYRAAWVRLAMALELGLGHWRTMLVLRCFRQEQEHLRETRGELDNPYLEQLTNTARSLNLSVDAVERAVTRWMIQRPCKWLRLFRRRSLLTEIERFRSCGGRTALVSDYPSREKLGALGALGLFDVVVANGEAEGPRRLKPSPEGFLLAAGRLGVSPPDCLVIGDRIDVDGLAARRAGMAFRHVSEPVETASTAAASASTSAVDRHANEAGERP